MTVQRPDGVWRRLVVLPGVVVLGVAAVAAGGARQSVAPAERTLSERAAAVDAILRVRIVGAPAARAVDIRASLQKQNPNLTLTDAVVMPVTEYDAEVLEVVKEPVPGSTGAAVRFGGVGGEAPWEGRTVVTDHPNAELVPGASYLVFLRQSPDFGLLMFLDYDVFRLDGAQVTANAFAAGTEYGKGLVGRTPDEAMELVRRAISTRQ